MREEEKEGRSGRSLTSAAVFLLGNAGRVGVLGASASAPTGAIPGGGPGGGANADAEAAAAGGVGSSPNASSNEKPEAGGAGRPVLGGVSPKAESKSAKLGSTAYALVGAPPAGAAVVVELGTGSKSVEKSSKSSPNPAPTGVAADVG